MEELKKILRNHNVDACLNMTAIYLLPDEFEAIKKAHYCYSHAVSVRDIGIPMVVVHFNTPLDSRNFIVMGKDIARHQN